MLRWEPISQIRSYLKTSLFHISSTYLRYAYISTCCFRAKFHISSPYLRYAPISQSPRKSISQLKTLYLKPKFNISNRNSISQVKVTIPYLKCNISTGNLSISIYNSITGKTALLLVSSPSEAALRQK